MNFKYLKRKIAFLLYHYKFIWNFAYQINRIIFHWKEREQHKHFGALNPSIKFYVLRSSEQIVGLMSQYFIGLDTICRCERENLVPVIDFLNYKTQYNVDFPVNGTYNSWEYYFEQPCKYSLDEVYQSRNVILSGWKFTPPHQQEITDEDKYRAMQKSPIKQYIHDIANKKIKSEKINDMIGVLIRGTDYIKLRPIGHAIPPTPEQASEKVDEFLKKYGNSRIFLATEDKSIYNYFVSRYGDMVYTSDDEDNLIENYSGKSYLSEEISSNTNKYKFGLDYLVKMICLSECKCLISSPTAGASFARMFNHGRYLEDYIFNLGVY